MRIAIVGNFGLTGNQTMAVRALPIAQQLASIGHSVRLALPVRTTKDVPGTSFVGGVEIRQFSSKLPLGPQCYILQIAEMLLWCACWSPSAVYCFKPIAHSGVVLGAFLALRRIGLFRGTVVLDTDDWEGDGGWNEKHGMPWWVKRLISWQEKWSIRHADAVTAASVGLGHLVGKAGGLNTAYVPNCLRDDSPALREGTGQHLRKKLGIGSGHLVLVYTRFVEYSLNRLLSTFEAIVALEPEVTFVVAGTGLRGEEDDLKQIIKRNGMEMTCRVVGWVEQEDLPDLFAAADVAVYLMDDNLLNRTKCPMKLVELTSAGVPVVADRVGQIAQYLEEGRTGILVPPGDVGEMASATLNLLGDPDRRRSIRSAARVAATRWRWPAWTPLIEKALSGQLNARSRP